MQTTDRMFSYFCDKSVTFKRARGHFFRYTEEAPLGATCLLQSCTVWRRHSGEEWGKNTIIIYESIWSTNTHIYRFNKWPKILNWSKRILVVNLLTEILLTLLTCIALPILRKMSVCRRQWRSQGPPGWASRPPGEPNWGRKWGKIEEKWEKLKKNEEN